MSDSFASLFRRSNWARFDPSLNRIYKSSSLIPPSRPFNQPASKIGSPRPLHFGFKRDLPASYYGRPLESVIIHDQDGEFGQCELSAPRRAQNNLYNVLTEAKEALQKKTQIPVRILNATSQNGWAVGIGGVVGLLAASDLPDGFRITRNDVLTRRAYWAWVREVRADGGNGRPVIHVTLKKPVSVDRTSTQE